MYSGYATISSLPFCPNIFFDTVASGPKSNATAVSPRDAVYARLQRDLRKFVENKIIMKSKQILIKTSEKTSVSNSLNTKTTHIEIQKEMESMKTR